MEPIESHEYWQAIRPITKEEAIRSLQLWEGPYPVLKFSECEALVQFAIRCRATMTAYAASHYLRSFSQFESVLSDLYFMPQGPSELARLRRREDAQVKRHTDLLEAQKKLEEAARLIGVRPTLFYSFDSPEERDTRLCQFVNSAIKMQVPPERIREMVAKRQEIVSSCPPSIVGETPEENKARAELNSVLRGESANIDETLTLSNIQRYDSRMGSGGAGAQPSTDNLAIRMLWNVWPEKMKRTDGDWLPYSVASRILKFCGHSINSNAVGKIARKEIQQRVDTR